MKTNKSNFRIVILTILSFIFLCLSAIFIANESVKVSAKEPIKKTLITPQNSYETLTAVIDEDQESNVITTSIYVTYLFDEENYSIFGALVELYHYEFKNGIMINDYDFINVMEFTFDNPLVIGAENNNPYIAIEYELVQYQQSRYFIPHISFEIGNDNYSYTYFQAANSDNGAFTSSLNFYNPTTIYNLIANNSYQLAYMLFSDSFESGYQTGKTEGYNQGYQTGKTEGYSEGYADGSDGSFSPSWLSALFSSLDTIFQVEIFPNFKLWYLIGAPLMVALVIAVLKFLR